jgi:glucose/mannose transport system substrate-binding protein
MLRHAKASTRSHRLLAAFAAALSALATSAAQAGAPVEVLHWWTSVSEAAALEHVKTDLARRGHPWQDSSVAGGDDRKRLIAAARADMRRQPDAVQLHANSLRERSPQFASLQSIAMRENWDAVLPPAVRNAAKVDGRWLAAPINIHRSNWVWANKRIFDQLHLAPPRTFAEMIDAATRIQAAGYLPFAHGGEAWQEALVFDSAVLSVGGANFYRKALLELDAKALGGESMVKVFEQLEVLRGLVDPDAKGRAWNMATAMVVHGKAGMQVMGDWAKGEFLRAGKKPSEDFICFAYPGAEGYVFVADLFAMPTVEKTHLPGQAALASTLMNPEVQRRFNLEKGSIPARTDVSLDGFDDCAKRSAADLRAASAKNALVSRYVAEVPEAARNAVSETVSRFFAGRQTARDGARELAEAVHRARRL